jgi:2-dehydro-3-deoxyphosphogluconate aldolase / (4S)-4-hydroxy-2-oxoglutarate aldolase
MEASDLTHGIHPPRAAARRAITEALMDAGAVAVVRLPDISHGEVLARALLAGGMRAIEVTLTTDGALELIATLTTMFGDSLLIGAGSVLTADAARRAIDAGARYIVSPVFEPEVLTAAHAADVPALPGAFTPTEILRAYHAGADLVKVFPSDALGPDFVRSVLAPMPFLELMPTGGVTPENVGRWITAGAVAVGLGSALVDPALVSAGDFQPITERARTVTAGIAVARQHARQNRRTT